MERPTILMTEDDAVMANLVQFMLEREGYQVHTATDGRQATRLIGAMPPPSLILLDIMLPYVDGLQLVKVIRAREGWREIPIIMLTSRAEEGDVVRALDAGASDYICKPFRPKELVARVRRFVQPVSNA
jgi:DNA-binding response OmpR family regulator